MATIQIDVPTAAHATRVMDAFAGTFGYQVTISDVNGAQIPNPETKAQFAKRKLAEYVKSIVINYEARVAADQARDNAVTNASGINVT